MPKINYRDYDEENDETPRFEKVVRNRTVPVLKFDELKKDFSDARRTKILIRGYDE